MVAITVIGIVGAILLDRLAYYQEAAEKAEMEYAIRMIKGELRIHMSTMLVQGRAHDYVSLAGKNPIEWMEQRPPNYLGTLRAGELERALPGNWYFDVDRRALVYLIRAGRHFQSNSKDPKQVCLRIVAVANHAADDAASASATMPASVTIEVEPYRWF